MVIKRLHLNIVNGDLINFAGNGGYDIKNVSITSTLKGSCMGDGHLNIQTSPHYGFPIGVTMVGLVAMVTLFFVGMAVLMYCYLRILSCSAIPPHSTTLLRSSPVTIVPSVAMSTTENNGTSHQSNNNIEQLHQGTFIPSHEHKVVATNGHHPHHRDSSTDNVFIFITPPGSITPSFIGYPSQHSLNSSSITPPILQPVNLPLEEEDFEHSIKLVN